MSLLCLRPGGWRISGALHYRCLQNGPLATGKRTISGVSSGEVVMQRRLEMEAKYRDKLRRKMAEEGVEDLSTLKERKVQKQEASVPLFNATQRKDNQPVARRKTEGRSDSSPLKPLNEILNLQLITSKPHSREVIHDLWTTYHSSKTSPAGSTLLSATMTSAVYLDMTRLAEKYPLFVLPLPRRTDEGTRAWEFYLLECALFQRPPAPRLSLETLGAPQVEQAAPAPYSTVLFTPLEEYKLNQSFARPYLVLSHYTDLAASHDLVLLRGEITPSQDNPERLLLSPADAHMLAMGLQRFYLSSASPDDKTASMRQQLLRDFHEKQDEFKWETLLEAAWDL